MPPQESTGSHRSRARRHLAAAAAGVLVAAGIVVGIASPALARPVCSIMVKAEIWNNVGWVYIPAGGTSYSTLDCDMGYGAVSGAVKQLQIEINETYASRGITSTLATDGQFGNNTRNAVKAVQAYQGVGVDGTWGPQTRNAMGWSWCDQGLEIGSNGKPIILDWTAYTSFPDYTGTDICQIN